MTAQALCEKYVFKVLSMPEPEKNVQGGYVGDLLSWVMGRAKEENVWITIMSNINVAAVASLADVGLVLFAEGVIPDDSVIKTAESKGVNMASVELPAFEIIKLISEDI